VPDASLHLAPNSPWVWLVLLAALLVALAVWAYRFAVPPLPRATRAGLRTLRSLAFAVLVLLLAQPVLERPLAGALHVAVLVDRSASMSLPEPGGGDRAGAAGRAAAEIERAWRGRAAVRVLPFASRLGADTARIGPRGATAIGDALAALGASAEGQEVGAVVVVSDGAGNAGEDPVDAARRLGVPVHAVVVGSAGADRAVTGLEAPAEAQVGRPVPVRVRVTSTEERGTPMEVELAGEDRVLGRATLISPGPGAEAVAEFRAAPLRPGLATWTARVRPGPGESAPDNDARQVAFPVARGRLGVTVVSAGLNWDLTFLRRALAGDSSLQVTTWVRGRDGWRTLERRAAAGAPGSMRGQAVVVLDGIAPAEVSPAFDEGLAAFLREGGGVLALGGAAPGLARLRGGRFGTALGLAFDAAPSPRQAAPAPAPEARDLLAWDDDPARGERAWRGAAPLADLASVAPGAGDRVLVAAAGGGPALLFSRQVGRGQALLVNGAGTWRWSLSGLDDLSEQRGRQLWRRLVRWLAEPVQGEPLRVRPERWVTEGGGAVRLVATLQDDEFRPLPGASLSGEVAGADGRARRVEFAPAAAGTYVATLENLPSGRYRVTALAESGGRTLGRAGTEFAVDRWSLEMARVQPDSVTLAAMAAATGGRVARAGEVARWARGLEVGAIARRRTASMRLWESPWVFAVVVGALAIEWAWRRRRGLP
jgi:hypothetical protein